MLSCVMLLIESGCSAVRDELRHPGGYTGSLLDRRTFDSSQSKQLQLLRATLMIAMAARIGERSVSPEDGDAFARQLAEASREVGYAAADAGFGAMIDDKFVPTCTIGRGTMDVGDIPASAADWDAKTEDHIISGYVADDLDNCAGYYVNFESHLARIEERVIRAMLTALPTDKARKFINDATKGDVLSALWSLTKSFADLAAAFHAAAGVYRAGTETFAASMTTCGDDPSYDGPKVDYYREEYDTVFQAARCLGLSRSDLFDGDSVAGDALPRRVNAKAFHALFRIARSSCVAVPLVNSPDPATLDASIASRRTSCALIEFKPQRRPLDIPVKSANAANRGANVQVQPQANIAVAAPPAAPGVVPPP
jgi:hypothetical protein